MTQMNTDSGIESAAIKCPFDEALLRRFLSPDHPTLKNILNLWIMRGDGTQSSEDRTRRQLGEQAYEHFHWDSAASNGRVLLLARRYKHPQGVRPHPGFCYPAEWFWCFDQIEVNEETEPASPEVINGVPKDIRESLEPFPGLEWVSVRQVNFWSHGRGKPKRKHREAPEGIAFFRFQGGLGLTVTAARS